MKGIFIYQWFKVIFSIFYLDHLNRLLKKLLIFNSQDKNYKKRKTIFSIPMSKTIRPCNSITWNLDPKTIIHLYTIQLEPWDLTANGKISPEKKKKNPRLHMGLVQAQWAGLLGYHIFFPLLETRILGIFSETQRLCASAKKPNRYTLFAFSTLLCYFQFFSIKLSTFCLVP